MTKERAQEFKAKGNLAFQSQNFDAAVELFTKAIDEDPSDHVLYSNRSGAYASLMKYREALSDADKCVELKADWAKGWSRKGLAELSLGLVNEATESYTKGLEIDPQNAACLDGLRQASSAMTGGMFGGRMEEQIKATLSQNPKTAKYVEEDPNYPNQIASLAQAMTMMGDPAQLSMSLSMMSDPKIKAGLAAVLGFAMPEAGQEEETRGTETRAPEPQAAEPQAPEPMSEEDETAANVRKADELKAQGNTAYKAKNFAEAERLYKEAFEMNPMEILYLNNLAAVYMEQAMWDKCLETCQKALDLRYETKSDFSKVAKVYNRRAVCYTKMGDYQKAIDDYKKSLTEDNNRKTRADLREVERLFEKKKEEAYHDPVIAEEHRQKGNDHFTKKEYRQAKFEYDEAIKRNPKDPRLYSNRAAAYMQLFEYPSALIDAEKCLELDPNMAKGWARKGKCHLMLREPHKAMSAYEQGLKIDPESAECKEGLRQTMFAIRQSNDTGTVDEDQIRRAMADPEIQEIVRDPQFQLILGNIQQDPHQLESYLKDEKIARGLQKLMAAGILRMT